MNAFVLLLVSSIIESLLILISFFVRIPEWTTIVCGMLSIGCLIVFCNKEKIAIKHKVIAIIISLLSVVWGIWSAYFLPYWGSYTIRYVFGEPYRESLNSGRKLPADEVINDIVYVRDNLQRVHLACMKSLPDSIQEKINCSINDLSGRDSVYIWEEYQHIQRFLSLLNDVHTEVLHVSSRKRYLDINGPYEILEVNDIPINNIYEQKRNLISSETFEWTKKSINDMIRSYDGLQLLGLLNNNEVSFTYKDSSSTICTRHFSASNFSNTNSNNFSLSSPHIGGYALNDTTKTAYLRMDNCFYYSPRARSRFNSGIDQMFASICEKDYKSLIIDLRGNPGGNPAIIHSLIRHMPIKLYHIGKMYVRRGPILVGMRNVFHNSWPKKDAFTGTIYVLTSLSTFSAAMQVADCLQGNGLAKIVGESPGNLPVSYGNIVYYVLPFSKLTLKISTSSYERTDTSVNSKRLLPDIPCEPNDALNVAYLNASRQ